MLFWSLLRNDRQTGTLPCKSLTHFTENRIRDDQKDAASSSSLSKLGGLQTMKPNCAALPPVQSKGADAKRNGLLVVSEQF